MKKPPSKVTHIILPNCPMCNAVERIVGEKKEEKGKKRHKLTFVRFKNVNFQSIYVPVRDLPGLCQLQRHHNVIQSLLGHLVT